MYIFQVNMSILDQSSQPSLSQRIKLVQNRFHAMPMHMPMLKNFLIRIVLMILALGHS